MGNAASRIKSQSIIETSFMLIAAILLLLGIFRIGLWYNNDLAERQLAYQASRVAAGSSEIGKWPVYARRPLTENWVLKGENFPASQPAGAGAAAAGRTRNTACEDAARANEQQAVNNIKQALILENEANQLDSEANQLDSEADRLDSEAAQLEQQADYYQKLYEQCRAGSPEEDCFSYLQQAQDYRAQAQAKRAQSRQKRQQAQQKRDLAEQKRQEAQRLRDEAEQLFDDALEIRKECWK